MSIASVMEAVNTRNISLLTTDVKPRKFNCVSRGGNVRGPEKSQHFCESFGKKEQCDVGYSDVIGGFEVVGREYPHYEGNKVASGVHGTQKTRITLHRLLM